ncbi:STAS domain-containing protein [Amycolatopsis sp. OK19-0408]|uniref:Anti-sigma factor antagonist n=1 Tax=Amycolatopsis iheyensis TaxID=2945988 RepID=A0A9X2NAJ4_9PSEU|nr:STAS domain-containing protein [Amycolatopsis iheyensis]MCR6483184.1 STAS domain-containing protein [Amycolatopsis iheyensis]
MDDAAPAGAPPLRISHRRAGTAHVVTVAGEIDAGTARELRRELAPETVTASAPELVVVDLSEVGFIDSAGLTALAGLHRNSLERGVRLTVVAGTRPVKRAFAITGLDELITVVPTLDDAIHPE